MASTVTEIRQKQRKIVILPSGVEIEIKKILLASFIGVGELPLPQGETVPEMTDGEGQNKGQSSTKNDLRTIEEARRYAARTIVSGAVDPRFSDRDEDREKEDIAHVDDLGEEDMHFLAGEILKWSGFTREVVADAETFRSDELSDNGRSSSGEISQAPERDT